MGVKQVIFFVELKMGRKILEHKDKLSEIRDIKIQNILDVCAGIDQQKITEEAYNVARIAANHLLAAFELRYRAIDREVSSQLLFCIGTELLLHAIIILEKPQRFIKLCGDKKKPPTFERSKANAQPIIVANFDKVKKNRMTDVLELIQSKRNIFAHLSTGIHAYYYQHYEMLNVICYLLSRYFPDLNSSINTLKMVKEKFRITHCKDYDYVSFDV